ncbi:hypothetical protein BC937DRAFT_91878 [Endogone sp. FLAS-F59071]|nr:hypothetical protein BC937DRAFT_91878 [Endogone sp. FLAS-F59071]|eukprot:RUS15864.1 hypothetical protein BC937DRAFT_91878 [Endogone sp. FLAS-F59071]
MKITPLEEEAKTLSKLREKAEEIARIDNEMKGINQDIRQLEDKLIISGSTKTIDECQREQGILQLHRQVPLGNGRQNIRSELELLNNENSRVQDELTERRDRFYHTKEELRKMCEQVESRERLQNNIAELQNNVKAQEEREKSLDAEMLQIQSDITNLTKQLQECHKERIETENAAQSEVNSLQQSLDKVNNIGRDIQSCNLDNGTARLVECDAQAVKLKQQIVELELSIQALGNKISDLNKRVSDEKMAERNISDNLRFRYNQRKITDMEASIAKLRHEERHDPALYSLQTQKLKVKQMKLGSEQSSLEGQVQQMIEQTEKFEEELRTEFKNSHEDWRKQLIKLKTSQMANTDLDKYSRALDNAIARYHSMKMEELNKIIHELWMNTYQGNDIDRIEIRSDNDSTVGVGVKSYDYRVVMIKGDTELDMRGRCSAGQKVLTSIMIRLALAETFCINCGILALDEPTTNLDKPNIESLAKSLVEIIKTRRQQSNFQLIIITHDEEFSSMLGKSEFADHYWRVFKDDAQHSTVEKELISTI